MVRTLVLSFAFVLCSGYVLAQSQSFSIGSITLDGTSLNHDALARMLALKEGQTATASDLQAAADRLGQTGLFSSVRFAYRPVGPQRVAATYTVVEPQEFSKVLLDLPSVDERAVWSYLMENVPAYDHKVPPTDGAQALYVEGVERYLASIGKPQEVAIRSFAETMSARSQSAVVIQAKALPHIQKMEIVGASTIDATAIKRVEASLLNLEYSSLTIRNIVLASLNVDCEALGLLRTRVTSAEMTPLSADSVSVRATVEEGPVYHFASIHVADAPDSELNAKLEKKFGDLQGRVANLSDFLRLALNLDRDLAKRGLKVSSGYEVALDNSDSTVTVLVHVRAKKG